VLGALLTVVAVGVAAAGRPARAASVAP